MLYAVRPEAGYFDLSSAGKVSVDGEGFTTFAEKEGGRDRYMILKDEQKPRATEALTLLSSEPPSR